MPTFDSIIDRSGAQALMPEEVARQIIQGLPAESVALSTFRRVTMGRAQQRMPVLSALPLAYWVDGDTGLKQSSNLSWDNKYLDARELAVIVPIPSAVLDDAAYDIWGEVRPRIIEALGAKIDAATLFGTDSPAGWPDGIVQSAEAKGNSRTIGDPAENSNATSPDFSVELSETFALVEAEGFDVSAVFGPRRIKARLRGLRATTGEPVWTAGGAAEGSVLAAAPDAAYGEPLRYVANGAWDPTVAAIVGDSSAAILGLRQDLTYQVFTEGVISDADGKVVLNLMQQDAIAMRAIMRVGFQVANPISILAPDEDTRWPFAVLLEEGS